MGWSVREDLEETMPTYCKYIFHFVCGLLIHVVMDFVDSKIFVGDG